MRQFQTQRKMNDDDLTALTRIALHCATQCKRIWIAPRMNKRKKVRIGIVYATCMNVQRTNAVTICFRRIAKMKLNAHNAQRKNNEKKNIQLKFLSLQNQCQQWDSLTRDAYGLCVAHRENSVKNCEFEARMSCARLYFHCCINCCS